MSRHTPRLSRLASHGPAEPRHRPARPARRVHLLAAAAVGVFGCLAGLMASAADVTITGTTVGGPQFGQGGLFTLTTTATISSGGEGIVATGTGEITTLTAAGVVDAFSQGINNNAGGAIDAIDVSGTTAGGFVGLLTSGTLGRLSTTAGGRIASGGGAGIRNAGTITGTVANAGTIVGFSVGLDNVSSGRVAAFTNSGLVQGSAGILTAGTITALTNQAGGSVVGGDYGLWVNTGGRVDTLVNSGSASGYNGLFSDGAIATLTNSGTFAGSYQGIAFGAASTTGSFGNSGRVSGGGDWGMYALAGAAIDTLVNSGTVTGFNGIVSSATIGTITNQAGGLIEGPGNRGLGQYASLILLDNAGSITGYNAIDTAAGIGTIINQPGGLIQGTVIGLQLGGTANTVTTITNAGAILAASPFQSDSAIGTLTNAVSGTISGSQNAVVIRTASGTVANAGQITSSGGHGVFVQGAALTRLTNSGTITASTSGVHIGSTGVVTTATNSGFISGSQRALRADAGTSLGTITNSGTMQGNNSGVMLYGASGTLSNLAGGLITSAANDAVFVAANLTSLSNAGVVQGVATGVNVLFSGVTLRKLTNTGTITATTVDIGAAVRVGAGAQLGDASGVGGPAIESTGAGARLNGTILNRGTIHHGFVVENQDVTVSGFGSFGVFASGTLAVPHGDLRFTDGFMTLGADVVVRTGTGTFVNEALTSVRGRRTLLGNFSQAGVAMLGSIITGTDAYGSLLIDGTASFAGKLDLDLNGLVLADGQVFDLLAFDSRSGEFSGLSVDGVALVPAGIGQWAYGSLVLQETWTPTSLSIAVVPEPSALGLTVAVGGLVAAWGRGSRQRLGRGHSMPRTSRIE